MKRHLLAALLLGVLAVPAVIAARPIRTGRGALLSCPDPSVVDARSGHYRYYLVCTSDYAPDAYPIRGSNDLVHWRLVGYVFPHGRQPWWAEHSPAGRFWAPAIYRIHGRWVVYFAAQFDAAKVPLRFPHGRPGAPGTFVLGVAFARSLRGPWHSRLLHYRGQDNGHGGERERYGGVIDPSMVQDPQTGQRYLFWAEQHTSIWTAKLSRDGLTLSHKLHQALWAQAGWECRTPGGRCTVEGPEETYRHGWFYLFFSGASTWSGTYAVGVAVSTDPLAGRFRPLGDSPILRSGHGWLGPGGTSAPVTGPDGRDYLFYHAMPHPDTSHDSALRYLFMSRVNWRGLGGANPLINDGLAG